MTKETVERSSLDCEKLILGLPEHQSKLAQETLGYPYFFYFLNLPKISRCSDQRVIHQSSKSLMYYDAFS